MQRTQTIEFAVTRDRDKGSITRIGRTGILQPKINFSGDTVKWYNDKSKKKQLNNDK
ncbi:MAG: hypothetical protein K2N73_14100 [Lachnospiraceae bacterium]|nr:hypothetical protein [Lachnospiraceae bacterium]